MMEYLAVCAVSLLAAGLTFFSGFGLGTILTPFLALFFPVSVAIAATAVVHVANNLFKLVLVKQNINKGILMSFAIPAIIAAFFGAWLLSYATALPPIGRYHLGAAIHEITLVKLVIGILIVSFSLLELIPKFANMAIDPKYLPLGGLLSGFFGGISGNQGALRSMFLIKAGLSKEDFIGTGVAIAVMVDIARLAVYGIGLFAITSDIVADMGWLILAATLSAFAGSLIGRKLLKKMTLRTIQLIVGIMLVILGTALTFGII